MPHLPQSPLEIIRGTAVPTSKHRLARRIGRHLWTGLGNGLLESEQRPKEIQDAKQALAAATDSMLNREPHPGSETHLRYEPQAEDACKATIDLISSVDNIVMYVQGPTGTATFELDPHYGVEELLWVNLTVTLGDQPRTFIDPPYVAPPRRY